MVYSKRSDGWEREFTYVGTRGNTVIGYVIVNEKMRDRVVKFKIRERVNLNHISLGMKIEEEQRRGWKDDETIKKKEEELEIVQWKDTIQRFREMSERLSMEEAKEEQVEETRKKMGKN